MLASLRILGLVVGAALVLFLLLCGWSPLLALLPWRRPKPPGRHRMP